MGVCDLSRGRTQNRLRVQFKTVRKHPGAQKAKPPAKPENLRYGKGLVKRGAPLFDKTIQKAGLTPYSFKIIFNVSISFGMSSGFGI